MLVATQAMNAILTKLKAMLAYVPASARTFFVHMLTGKDNATFDISRVLLLCSGVAFIGISIYHVVKTGVWDATAFGIGSGAVLGGGGAGIRAKAITEPEA